MHTVTSSNNREPAGDHVFPTPALPHTAIPGEGFARSRHLLLLIREGKITLGGNKKLKIYGRLDCRSGRRMKATNRVFFAAAEQAISLGYRACKHCKPKGAVHS